MENQNHLKSDTADHELIATRILNAPRELVWKVWTDPEHVVQWWGPDGFTNTSHEMSVKPGGVWRLTMHGPDGRNYPNKIVFIEVIKPEYLSYKHSGDDEAEPVSHHVTVIFEKQGDKTKITMKMVFESAEELKRVDKEYGAIEGMKQCVNRLEKYVSKVRHETISN